MNRLVVAIAMTLMAVAGSTRTESNYQTIENWATFPPEVTTWSAATGVDIDPQGNIYVFHRSESMPIMAFDKVADLVIAQSVESFIADGESTNTRIVKYS